MLTVCCIYTRQAGFMSVVSYNYLISQSCGKKTMHNNHADISQDLVSECWCQTGWLENLKNV